MDAERTRSKKGAEFGKCVLESSAADDELRGEMLKQPVQVIFAALVGTGFLTCGFAELFAK
ncbi:MAG: hypothetical protein ACRBN8_44075 [Nannocystales bacterium]